MSTGVSVSELWFGSGDRRAGGDRRPVLFCLPHAGGGAAAFRGWAEALACEVAVLPVRLPGRERRLSEPAVIDTRVIAAAVVSQLRARDWPAYGFYGHSLGGWVAFEIIRELRRLDAPLPVRLYVGACRPPDFELHPHVRDLSGKPDAEIAESLLRLGGMPPEVFAHPDLRDLVLPVLRADFAWLDAYRYQPEPPLTVPVVGFAGSDDQVATTDDMADWSRHTSAGMTLRPVTGGHFFAEDQRDQVIDFIRADLPARDLRRYMITESRRHRP